MPVIRPVVLSGGSGTRLWPLSTAETPKQLARLIGDETLFARTMHRLDGVPGLDSAVVVTGDLHSHLVAEEVARTGVPTAHILVEPEGRNTAPAAVAAALVSDPGDVLVILPSDHLILDVEGFGELVERAAGHAVDGHIVTFGVKPSRPETGYGYIELGEPRDGAHHLLSFIEKPDADTAEKLTSGGRHLWNSGIFVVTAGTLISEAMRHSPQVVAAVREALPDHVGDAVRLGERFRDSPSISFDHAVMERTELGLVIPMDVGWSDLGSYRSLLEAGPRDESGNSVAGDVVLSDVSDSYVRATSRRLVVAGISGVAVVETPEAVLVVPLDRDQEVRELQDRPARS